MSDESQNDVKTISYKTAVRRSQDTEFLKAVAQFETKIRAWLKASEECPAVLDTRLSMRRLIATKFIEAINFTKRKNI